MPPSQRVAAQPADNPQQAVEQAQRNAWRRLHRHITSVVNKATESTVAETALALMRENIVRGRGVLVSALMRAQHANPKLSLVLASLVSVLNRHFPAIGMLLIVRLVHSWRRAHRRRDGAMVQSAGQFLSALYMLRVVEADIVLQLLIAYIGNPERTDLDIQRAVTLIEDTYQLLDIERRADLYVTVLGEFRQLLQSGKHSESTLAQVRAMFTKVQAWQRSKKIVDFVPQSLQLVDPDEQERHAIGLEDALALSPEDELDRFHIDPRFDEVEAQYDESRMAILGPDWQSLLPEAAAEADGESDPGDPQDRDDGDGTKPKAEHASTNRRNADNVQSKVDAFEAEYEDKRLLDLSADDAERELRKSIFVHLRSSATADEAAHNIMLHTFKPGRELVIGFMIVECAAKEVTEGERYAFIAQRLCRTRVSFQVTFEKIFAIEYKRAEETLMVHLQHTASIEAHLLRTDSIDWGRTWSKYNILEASSSQRVYLQHVLQRVASMIGGTELRQRLRSERLAKFVGGLFPTSPAEASRAYNLYVAMEVPSLGQGLLADDAMSRLRKRNRQQ